jgi:hypothetical protein
MFCDLVGSTSISPGLDAEDWRDLVGVYLDAASSAVTEMGGNVAKKLGDGVMALFGYPMAQENDAERAARAALCHGLKGADFKRLAEHVAGRRWPPASVATIVFSEHACRLGPTTICRAKVPAVRPVGTADTRTSRIHIRMRHTTIHSECIAH